MKPTAPTRCGRLFAVAALAALLMAVSGCAPRKPAPAAKHTRQPEPHLTVGLMPVADCLPFYVAGHSRIFAKNGVRVRVITYPSSLDCEAAFIRGDIEGAYFTLPQMLYVAGRVRGLKAVMGMPGEMTVVTSRSRRIRKLSSMGGRTVALSRHDTSEFLVDEIAGATGIKKHELLRPQVNNIHTRARMLAANQVDAAVLPAPHDAVSVARGNVRVYSTANTKSAFGSVCFHDSVIRKKSKHIGALVKSYADAAATLNAKPQAADSVLMKIFKLSPAETASLRLPEYSKPRGVGKDDFARALAWAGKDGYLKRKAEIDDVVSHKFVRK